MGPRDEKWRHQERMREQRAHLPSRGCLSPLPHSLSPPPGNSTGLFLVLHVSYLLLCPLLRLLSQTFLKEVLNIRLSRSLGGPAACQGGTVSEVKSRAWCFVLDKIGPDSQLRR